MDTFTTDISKEKWSIKYTANNDVANETVTIKVKSREITKYIRTNIDGVLQGNVSDSTERNITFDADTQSPEIDSVSSNSDGNIVVSFNKNIENSSQDIGDISDSWIITSTVPPSGINANEHRQHASYDVTDIVVSGSTATLILSNKIYTGDEDIKLRYEKQDDNIIQCQSAGNKLETIAGEHEKDVVTTTGLDSAQTITLDYDSSTILTNAATINIDIIFSDLVATVLNGTPGANILESSEGGTFDNIVADASNGINTAGNPGFDKFKVVYTPPSDQDLTTTEFSIKSGFVVKNYFRTQTAGNTIVGGADLAPSYPDGDTFTLQFDTKAPTITNVDISSNGALEVTFSEEVIGFLDSNSDIPETIRSIFGLKIFKIVQIEGMSDQWNVQDSSLNSSIDNLDLSHVDIDGTKVTMNWRLDNEGTYDNYPLTKESLKNLLSDQEDDPENIVLVMANYNSEITDIAGNSLTQVEFHDQNSNHVYTFP